MKSILVVDDDTAIRQLVCGFLSAADYQTLSAGDVAGARLHLSFARQVDAVVTDFELPDGTGLDLLAWLRQRGRAKLPSVLMSGSWQPEDSEAELSQFEFLSKPFLSVDLLAALERAFERVERCRPPHLRLPAAAAARDFPILEIQPV